MVAPLKPGAQGEVTLWRGDYEKKLVVRIGELQQETSLIPAVHDSGSRLGLVVRPLQLGEKHAFGLDHGLVVEDVTGDAARAGIRADDIILGVNGVPVHDIDELRNLADTAGKRMALRIQRDDSRLFVPMPLPQSDPQNRFYIPFLFP